MLRNAGVGDAIKLVASNYQINLIFLGWLVAVVLRIAQGSATVAMLNHLGNHLADGRSGYKSSTSVPSDVSVSRCRLRRFLLLMDE
jgi:hypothetical protein